MKTRYEVIICGAGIAGIASAYSLARDHGLVDVLVVDERPPLSLTSDKSTECYRNWWPGPGDAMVQMMNRSIDRIEDIARANGNPFHLNRRGYLYCTARADGVETLRAFAAEASALGAGDLREHKGSSSVYAPHAAEGFEGGPSGADLLIGTDLIRHQFPYLSPEITAVLHVRRAGWLSAQQFGQYLLDECRAMGVEFASDHVHDIRVEAGRVTGVELGQSGPLACAAFLNAAGPLLGQVARMALIELPVYNELHLKASIEDRQGVLARNAPLVIFNDPQELSWSAEERAWLADDPDSSWLLETLPAGAHTRPEGLGDASSILMLWDIHEQAVEPEFPPKMDPMYAELALRGLSRMIPGFTTYLERLPQPWLDGGYYTRTQENRPLAGPMGVEGAFVIGAMSGYGIMASMGMAELVAAHIANADLSSYAPAFTLARYHDPAYQSALAEWGASWQL
jgi:glycine/D-amino acid oxidase-like deaminating enzyme